MAPSSVTRSGPCARICPADVHPLTDTAPVGAGRSGKVWLLGGTYSATPDAHGNIYAVVDRTCTIPEGIALLFPVVDAEASLFEGDGSTYEDLSAYAAWLMDHAQDLFCFMDGSRSSTCPTIARSLRSSR